MKKYLLVSFLAFFLCSCVDNNIFPLSDSEHRLLLFQQSEIGTTDLNKYILYTENPAKKTVTGWRDTVAHHYRRYYHDYNGKTIAFVIHDFDELNNVMVDDSMIITRPDPNKLIITNQGGFVQNILKTDLPNGGNRIRITNDNSSITFKHYNYNSAGLLDSSYHVQDLGSGIIDHQMNVIVYDGSGVPLRLITHMWHQGEPDIFRRTYTFTKDGREDPVLLNLLRYMSGPNLFWMTDNIQNSMESLFVNELSDRLSLLKGNLQTLNVEHARLDRHGNWQEDLVSFNFQFQTGIDSYGRLNRLTRTRNGVIYQDARYTYYR